MGLVVPKSPVMGKICAYAHLICAHIAHWPLCGRVVIKRESGYITKTSHPCISGRGWILKILRTPQGVVEYPYFKGHLRWVGRFSKKKKNGRMLLCYCAGKLLVATSC